MVEREQAIHRRPGHQTQTIKIELMLAEKDIEYPARRDEIAEAVGREEVEIEPGRTLPLRTIVENLAPGDFRELPNVMNWIDAQWGDWVQMARGEPPFTEQR